MPRGKKQNQTGFPVVSGTPIEPEESAAPNIQKRFVTADGPETALMQRVLKQTQKPLVDAQVTIGLQFWNDPEGAPSVVVSGYEEFGKIIIVKPEDRALGYPDARLIIDGMKWDHATAGEREGELAHLLARLELRTKVKSGEVIRDDAGRPKLKFRKYDIRICGFSAVAKEFGNTAPETKAFRAVAEVFTQLALPFDGAAGVAA